jgi:3-phenylpropionate/trans-cinnamate dioxygenase ferredoxin reductase subunit
MGARATLVEQAATVLDGVLGTTVGGLVEAFLRERGVHVRTRTRALRLEGDEAVEAVTLADGGRLHAAAVVVAAGVRPETRLAERAGLRVQDGILVDRQLRAADRVWAAGDAASAEHPTFGRIRPVSWAEARHQGWLAGAAMAGGERGYERVPRGTLSLFDLSATLLGAAAGSDRLVLRGDLDPAEPRLVAWYLRGATPRAALVVNWRDAEEQVAAALGRGAPADPERLADPTAPPGAP